MTLPRNPRPLVPVNANDIETAARLTASTVARAAAADKAAKAAIARAATIPVETPLFDHFAAAHGYAVWPPFTPRHDDHMAAVDQTGWVGDLLGRLEALRDRQAATP